MKSHLHDKRKLFAVDLPQVFSGVQQFGEEPFPVILVPYVDAWTSTFVLCRASTEAGAGMACDT